MHYFPNDPNPPDTNEMLFYYDSHPCHYSPYGPAQPAAPHFPASHHQEPPCTVSQLGGATEPGAPHQTSWPGQALNSSFCSSRTPVFDDWSCGSPVNSVNGSCNPGFAFGGVHEYFAQPQYQHSPDSGVDGCGQQSPDSSDGVSGSGSESPACADHHRVLTGSQDCGSGLVQHGLRPQVMRGPYDWMKKASYMTQFNPGKTRTNDKYRVVYSEIQRLELEKEFHYSRYITMRRKAELAQLLGLSERQVKIWFQNRRAKERKQVKKREDLVQKEKDIYNKQ